MRPNNTWPVTGFWRELLGSVLKCRLSRCCHARLPAIAASSPSANGGPGRQRRPEKKASIARCAPFPGGRLQPWFSVLLPPGTRIPRGNCPSKFGLIPKICNESPCSHGSGSTISHGAGGWTDVPSGRTHGVAEVSAVSNVVDDAQTRVCSQLSPLSSRQVSCLCRTPHV